MKHIDTRLLNQARAVKLSRGRYDLSNEQIIQVRHLANAGVRLPEILEALGWTDRPVNYCQKILREKYRIIPKSQAHCVHRGDLTPWYCPPKEWRPKTNGSKLPRSRVPIEKNTILRYRTRMKV
jgi:hypothetical protein